MPLLRLRGHYFAIATLGVAEGMREVVINLPGLTGGGAGITIPTVGNDGTTPYLGNDGFYLLFLALAALAVLIGGLVSRSKLGYALRAIHQDEDAAAAVGVNTTRSRCSPSRSPASSSGWSASTYAFQQVTIFPERLFDVEITVLMVVMVVIGGSGTVLGPLLGAVACSSSPSTCASTTRRSAHPASSGAIIIVAVVLLPQGLVNYVREARRSRGVLVAGATSAGTGYEPDAGPGDRSCDLGMGRRFGGLQARRRTSRSACPRVRHSGSSARTGPARARSSTWSPGTSRPTPGRVLIDGHDLTGARPWSSPRARVARTFQIVKPFRGMTVRENVAIGILYGPDGTGAHVAALTAADEVLDEVGLAGVGDRAPGELTVADARRLEFAKALALRPRLLLLDEVMAGLRPTEIEPCSPSSAGSRSRASPSSSSST